MAYQDIKETLKNKLKNCDKEVLIDIIAEVCSLYVNARVFSDSDKKTAENFGIDYMDVEDFIRK